MPDYIEREYLMKKCFGVDLTRCVKHGNQEATQRDDSYSTMLAYEIADSIMNCPTENVVPVVQGKWLFDEENDVGDGNSWACSKCGESLWMKKEWNWHYCPNCGARNEWIEEAVRGEWITDRDPEKEGLYWVTLEADIWQNNLNYSSSAVPALEITRRRWVDMRYYSISDELTAWGMTASVPECYHWLIGSDSAFGAAKVVAWKEIEKMDVCMDNLEVGKTYIFE